MEGWCLCNYIFHIDNEAEGQAMPYGPVIYISIYCGTDQWLHEWVQVITSLVDSACIFRKEVSITVGIAEELSS